MTTVIIIAAVLIVIVLFLPSKKKKGRKKGGNGTGVWENTSSMRIAQFVDYICRKIKELIGE